jgi:hypothetical protein
MGTISCKMRSLPGANERYGMAYRQRIGDAVIIAMFGFLAAVVAGAF